MRTLALAGIVIAAAACDADGLGNHGCPVETFGGWRNYQLSLEHSEPRTCPYFLDAPGSPVTTGARIVDGGLSKDAFLADLRVVSSSNELRNETSGFFRDAAGGRWAAELYVSYRAGLPGLAPDVAEFDVFQENDFHLGSARMRITYTDAVQAEISGPAMVWSGESYTWTAAVRQGVAPFTFRWYRDWELVETGPSYTEESLGSDMTLRLDVVDARGEADSHTITVRGNACDPGVLRC